MATFDDLRRIALTLPETEESADEHRFTIRGKGIAWPWRERIAPKKGRVPRYDIYGIRVSGEWEKADLLEIDPDKYFTEPHYNGYPAILVRLDQVDGEDLTALLTNAWRCQAPKALVKAFDAQKAS